MDIESLSSRQVQWAHELSRYHFCINYCQGKANAAADALSRFLQRSQAEEETLRAENSQILRRLQSLLTNASLAGLSLSGLVTANSEATNLFPLHQVLICKTHVLLRLPRFWETLRGELTGEGPYQPASLRGMRLRLPELQAEDQEARRIRAQSLKDGWGDIEGVLNRECLPYLPEIIRTEVISRHHDDPLAGHFRIDKTHSEANCSKILLAIASARCRGLR